MKYFIIFPTLFSLINFLHIIFLNYVLKRNVLFMVKRTEYYKSGINRSPSVDTIRRAWKRIHHNHTHYQINQRHLGSPSGGNEVSLLAWTRLQDEPASRRLFTRLVLRRVLWFWCERISFTHQGSFSCFIFFSSIHLGKIASFYFEEVFSLL